jgi:hypothetical protein
VRGAAAVATAAGYLLAACDALGAIGAMPADTVAAPWPLVGRLTARVALMELIALGAEPRLLAVAAVVAPGAVLAGVREEAAVAGLAEDDVAWSAERNMAPKQTAVGVTAVGLAPALRLARAGSGLAMLALGRPKAGAAVWLGDPETADLPALRRVLACPSTVAVSPAGSGGLAERAQALAAEAGMRFVPEFPADWDPAASAGPATALVCVTPEPDAVAAAFGGPAAVIGRLVPC